MSGSLVIYLIFLAVIAGLFSWHSIAVLTEVLSGRVEKISFFKGVGALMLLVVYLLLWPVVEDAHAKQFVLQVPQKVPISCVDSTEIGGHAIHDGATIRDTRELAFPIIRCSDSSVASGVSPGNSIHIDEKFD